MFEPKRRIHRPLLLVSKLDLVCPARGMKNSDLSKETT
jgi:hypothetical protein